MIVGLKRATKGLKKARIKSVNMYKWQNLSKKKKKKMGLHIDFT